MAKLCPQCNMKYANSADKCIKCGAELEVIKSDVKKKRIIIVSIISVLLIAAIIVGVLYFTSPEAKVRAILNDFKQGNVEDIINSFPEFFKKSGFLNEEAFAENVARLSDYMFSYNVNKAANPSTRETTEILESLSTFEEYGYDYSKLQEIKIVWTDMRGGIPGLWGNSMDKFTMIKYDGAWYWWPLN